MANRCIICDFTADPVASLFRTTIYPEGNYVTGDGVCQNCKDVIQDAQVAKELEELEELLTEEDTPDGLIEDTS